MKIAVFAEEGLDKLLRVFLGEDAEISGQEGQGGVNAERDGGYDVVLCHSLKEDIDVPCGSVALYNADCQRAVDSWTRTKQYLITYGLSGKASITASSIENDEMMLCVQRTISDVTGRKIEPQEIPVDVGAQVGDVSEVIACAAAALVCGKLEIKN